MRFFKIYVAGNDTVEREAPDPGAFREEGPHGPSGSSNTVPCRGKRGSRAGAMTAGRWRTGRAP